MIHFADKIYFLLLFFIPLLILWDRFLKRVGKQYILYSSKKLTGDSNQSWKVKSFKTLFYIKVFCLFLLIVAMARPQILNFFSVEKKQGIDILITLDISGSMASIDFKPKNRLEVAKDVINNFINKRKNDRLGLVIFAGTSYTKCPLTIDYEMLQYFLRETTLGELEDGTAIGMALATSVNRIRLSKTSTKIVILLTDGVNNKGEIDPRDAANIAKDMNIKVYTIGVGTRGRAPYPVKDSFGRLQHIMVDVEIDEELLKEMAAKTGGFYFRATDGNSLQRIFQEIDRFERSEVSTRNYQVANDLYQYFLISALLLLGLVEFSKRTFLRTLP